MVDDDGDARHALERLLRADGFATSGAADGEEALAEARRAPYDLVLTDLAMWPMDGVELCKHLHELDPDLPVIVMTAHSDMHSVIETLRQRAEDYLVKPLQYDAVLWCVDRALSRRAAKLEQAAKQRALNERLVLASIREQEHAEAQARHVTQLTALLENLSDGVLIADTRSGDVMVNEGARAIMGIARADARAIDEVLSLEVRDLDDRPLAHTQRPLARALRGEQFEEYEVLRVRPNGERRHVANTGTSVLDEDGNVALAIVVFRDVTELRRLERQRDEYLALVSHDLRNPLGVVLLSLETLKLSLTDKGVPLASRVELTERAARNARRMKVMLDELREATTFEAHEVVLRLAPCDMRELVANVVDTVDDAHPRRITVETDDAPPYLVLADGARLERVVANLLTNALKYSSEDSPVSVRLTHEGGAVELHVADRGIGIAPESVKRLFERYYRSTEGKAQAGGLGLGLYIARMIVELHGGRIELESELGEGSTFKLILPSHPVAS